MIRKGYLDLPAGQIHYRHADPSNPTRKGSLLFLHQKASSSKMWDPVLPLVAIQGYQAVALDLPGHGESFQPDQGQEFFSLPALAGFVSEAMDSLNLCKPILVVGHHLGAAVALQLAADFPSKVDKLALWGVPIMDEATKKILHPPPNFDDEELTVVLQFWKIRDKFAGKPGYKMPWQTRVARLTEMLQNDPNTTQMLYTMDVECLFKRVTQPTLCMYGDMEMLKEQTIRTAQEVETATVCVIPHGGIDVADEYPEEFTNALVEFLS